MSDALKAQKSLPRSYAASTEIYFKCAVFRNVKMQRVFFCFVFAIINFLSYRPTLQAENFTGRKERTKFLTGCF